MTTIQKAIKYLAMAFAIFLTVSILGGILGMLGIFTSFFDGDKVEEDVKSYPVSADIKSLTVSINAADFTIKQGESFSVESNLKHLSVEDKGGVLTVKETKRFGSTYKGAVLTLYIPEDAALEKAKITTGAGRMTVERLSAGKVIFELGAGEVKIDTLIATESVHMEGGAGKITISDGALHNPSLEMGVGQLNLTSVLTGEGEFDLGVGESNITVIGNKDDYTLDIEKGIGDITVDGVGVSGIKEQGRGNNSIELSGGIGAIHLNFEEK